MTTIDASSKISASTADDELWGLRAVLAKTGLSRSTVYAYVAIGLFPKQRRPGLRRVAWLASEVREWIAKRPQWLRQLVLSGQRSSLRTVCFLKRGAPLGGLSSAFPYCAQTKHVPAICRWWVNWWVKILDPRKTQLNQ